MKAAPATATALGALAACTAVLAACTAVPRPKPPPNPQPTPPPSRSSHAALSGGTFVRVEGDGYDQIYVLRPGATGWTLVGDTPKPPVANGRYWTLAPDGLLGAVIVDGTSLVVADVDGGPPRTVATAPTGSTICAPAWSADSTRLAYLLRRGSGDGLRYVVNADGSRRLPLLEPPTTGGCDQPAAAVAGRVAAYLDTSGDDKSLVVFNGVLFTYVHAEIPGSPLGVLAVSPDMKHAVVLGVDGGGEHRFYLVEVPGGRAVPLPVPVTARVDPVLFAGDRRVLATVGPQVETFDLTGRLMSSSPVVTTRPAATVSLVTWSP